MTAPSPDLRPSAIIDEDDPGNDGRLLDLPFVFTAAWVLYVLAFGHLDRVVLHWRAAVTMVFGSFVAGSTPQGGGAVAFPVFTKILEIPAEVARSFSVSIQATGMVMASATIILAGRRIDVRAIAVAVSGAVVGLAIGLFMLSDPDTLFWSPRPDPAYIKVAFTVIVFAVALVVRRCRTVQTKRDRVERWDALTISSVAGLGVIGGIFTALTGSGVDVVLFIFLVLIAGVHPKVAIPTSIVTMAAVSVLAAAVLAVVGGQLSVGVAGESVLAVDNRVVGALPATRFDTFGLWLAAAPVVVWGAPLGSWVIARLSDRTVVWFVGLAAMAEVSTTILFLDRLRTDVALAAFGLAGLLFAVVAVEAAGRAGRRYEDRLDRVSRRAS